MARLRLVEERMMERGDLPDLRGFQDPELFRRTGIISYLRIDHVDHAFLINVCDAYDLNRTTFSSDPNAVFVKPRNTRPENHKIEALNVFTAALEIQTKFPKTHCTLFQISELRVLLRERIKEETQSESKEVAEHLLSRVTQVTRAQDFSGFQLDQRFAQAVHQAGLIPHYSESTWQVLTPAELLFATKVMTVSQGSGRKQWKNA
jgi:hypothetical protein